MLVHKENEIAKKLEESCTKDGKELDPKISAEFLHELALVYKERALSLETLNEKIYNKKMCVLQCAILLNAAIVRNPENKKEIKNILNKFCFELLQISTAKNKGSELIKITSKIKCSITTMRENIAELSGKIKIIPEDAESEMFLKLKEEKIKKVKAVQIEVTQTFRNIMQDLCNLCVTVMGDPPCKFALVGLGSLARQEITTYSDFEHVIVLEDGLKSYEKVKEYFRWFALIFQVILINLGETIIPCADIPSINGGKYSVFKFFDAHTPRGISPDGMVPYACKNPLGRLFETENNKPPLELIQPASIMASFIESEEDIKNGYHLADMLTMSCFVAGNLEIYEKFAVLVEIKLEHIKQNETNVFFASNKKEITENFKEFDILNSFKRLEDSRQYVLNIKRIVYRTSTLFISALGRKYWIRLFSCFDIVEELFKKSLFNSTEKINLQFAVAVACETRLKIYERKKSQDEMVLTTQNHSEIIEEVGIKSIVEYFVIIAALQKNLQLFDEDLKLLAVAQNSLTGYLKKGLEVDYRLSSLVLYHINQFERAIQESIKQLKLSNSEDMFLNENIAMSYLRLQDYEKAVEHFKIVLKGDLSVDKKANITCALGVCKSLLNQYSEALIIFKKALKLHLSITQNKELDPGVANAYTNIGNCERQLNLSSDSIKTHENALNIYKQLALKKNNIKQSWAGDIALCLSNIANCKIDLNSHGEAFCFYQQSLELYEKISTNQVVDVNLARVYYNIGACKTKLEYFEEAVVYYNKALLIYTNTCAALTGDKETASVYRGIGHCKLRLKFFDQAWENLEKAKKVYETLPDNQTQVNDLAQLYYYMGALKVEEEMHQDGKMYLEKSLKLFESLPNPDKNLNVANIYQEMSVNYHKMKTQPLKAIEYGLKALAVCESVSKDQAIDIDIADTYHFLSNYYYAANDFTNALHFCYKFLNIYDHISVSNLYKNMPLRLAAQWDIIGKCQHEFKEYTEAEIAYNKAIEMFETVSPYPFYQIAMACRNLGEVKVLSGFKQEGLSCYQKAIKVFYQSNIAKKEKKVAKVYSDIGNIHLVTQNFDDAILAFQTSLEIYKNISMDISIDKYVATLCSSLGSALFCTSQFAQALKYLQASRKIIEKGKLHEKLASQNLLNSQLLNLIDSVPFDVFVQNFCIYKN